MWWRMWSCVGLERWVESGKGKKWEYGRKVWRGEFRVVRDACVARSVTVGSGRVWRRVRAV